MIIQQGPKPDNDSLQERFEFWLVLSSKYWSSFPTSTTKPEGEEPVAPQDMNFKEYKKLNSAWHGNEHQQVIFWLLWSLEAPVDPIFCAVVTNREG